VRRELEEWLPSVAKEEDRCWSYFAGHGFGRRPGVPGAYDIVVDQIAKTAYRWRRWGRVREIRAKWSAADGSSTAGALAPEAMCRPSTGR